MTSAWLSQRERGSAALVKALAFVSLHAGQAVGRALLYPICAYFLLFAPAPRRASRDYLARALGRRPSFRDVFRHFHGHAGVLLDRLFIMVDGTRRFDLRVEGLEIVEEYNRAKQGCILLGAHIGSFEILRALAEERQVRVKVLMYPTMSRKFNQALASLNPAFADDIIALGDPTNLIQAGQFVRDGGNLALLGDRKVGNEKTVDADFFGRPASFPIGPLQLAAVLQAPVVLFVGLHDGTGAYRIVFEKFSEPPPRRERTPSPEVAGAWVDRYARRLEHYCRSSPYNWFNFFPIWRG